MFRKLIVLLLIAGCAFAGSAVLRLDSALSSSAQPLNENNAHWKIYNDGGNNVLACIAGDGPQHADYDYTWFYNSTPINLTVGSSPVLVFDLNFPDTAGVSGKIYVCDTEPTDSGILTSGTLIGEAEYTGGGYVTLLAELPDTIATAYIAFLWESADTIGNGPRVDNIRIGSFTYANPTQIHTESSGEWGTMSFDVGAQAAGHPVSFGFHYDVGGNNWEYWWAIDNVEIVVDGTVALLEHFESGDPGWHQIQRSGSVVWAWADSDGYCWGNGTYVYRAHGCGHTGATETFTPVVDCLSASSVDISYYSTMNAWEGTTITLNLYTPVYTIDDNCENMDNWDTVDEGNASNVVETSWGSIKAR